MWHAEWNSTGRHLRLTTNNPPTAELHRSLIISVSLTVSALSSTCHISTTFLSHSSKAALSNLLSSSFYYDLPKTMLSLTSMSNNEFTVQSLLILHHNMGRKAWLCKTKVQRGPLSFHIFRLYSLISIESLNKKGDSSKSWSGELGSCLPGPPLPASLSPQEHEGEILLF